MLLFPLIYHNVKSVGGENHTGKNCASCDAYDPFRYKRKIAEGSKLKTKILNQINHCLNGKYKSAGKGHGSSQTVFDAERGAKRQDRQRQHKRCQKQGRNPAIPQYPPGNAVISQIRIKKPAKAAAAPFPFPTLVQPFFRKYRETPRQLSRRTRIGI